MRRRLRSVIATQAGRVETTATPISGHAQMYRIVIFSAFLLPVLLFSCRSTEKADESPPEPPLIVAAERGQAEEVERLLSINSQADVRDACAWTPLMKAALHGRKAVVERLLQAGADPEALDKGGYTALMLAASNDHVEVVDLLIRHGANINHQERTEGLSALIWASKRGHVETVRLLLASGARTDLLDHDGRSARDWALERGDQLVTRLLSESPGFRDQPR